MSNYEKLYYTLFSGVSNLVENSRFVSGEAEVLRAELIELMRQCEELYMADGET